MSSTTDDRRGQRGQILVVFAGGLVFILAVAALVFDVGQNLLDRRTEQNVSDAAALAGANYVDTAGYTYHGFCSAAPGGMPAVDAACQLAAESGYVDGVNGRTVRVDIPPVSPSSFAFLASHIQVTIGSSRPSFFAGVLGIDTQNVGAGAVAKAAGDVPLPFSLLALNPTGCGANKITGADGTAVTTNGTIHINSECPGPPGALALSGNGVLTSPQCDVVGMIDVSNNATNNCTEAPAGVEVFEDPLRNLPPPPHPIGTTLPVQPLDGGPIPTNCPGGSNPATDASPKTCDFSTGPVSGKHYRLFPGNYPGGIGTSKAVLYLSPGIYWIGGSGINIQSDGAVVSKAAGDNTGMTPSGGVLIYNTNDPVPPSGCSAKGCYGPISINGGSSNHPTLALLPIQTGLYKNMTIFVDRTVPPGGAVDLDLNGKDANLNVSGTIYAPTASFRFNGGATDVLSAQVICYDFHVNGSGAAFTINYDPDDLFHLTGIGLVE